jgi:16S rRNA (adenine1518-N6/adenine1519-N6)-dimethyltransferase
MQYKIKAKRHLGQNFLQDESVISKIVRLAGVSSRDTVVEIGPGLGALTRHLLSATKDVNVIEFDKDIIPKLSENCQQFGQIKIFNEDILKFDISKISSDNKIKLLGNLPYNISSPILFRVVDFSDMIKDAHFMLQKEMVDRISAIPNNKSYGRLSVVMQYHFECSSIMQISPEAFFPKPKVDSSILRLKPRIDKPFLHDFDFFSQIVKQCFSQRRKTLNNNLKEILIQKNILPENLPIDVKLRAENLTVNDFVNLSNFIYKK